MSYPGTSAKGSSYEAMDDVLQSRSGARNIPSLQDDEKNHPQLEYIWMELSGATMGPDRYLSEKTAKKWLLEASKEQSPRSYFEMHIKKKNMRGRFDATNAALKEYPVSKDCPLMEPKAFWSLPIKERIAYLEKADEYMKGQKTLKQRVDQLRTGTFQKFRRITHEQLQASSKHDIAKLEKALQFVPTVKEADEWENFLEEAIVSARDLYDAM